MTIRAELLPISFPAVLAAAETRLVLAELGERERAALAGVDSAALRAYAETRTRAICEAARQTIRDRSIIGLADAGWTVATMDSDIRRYAASSWLRDRDTDHCPSRLAGRPESLIWLSLKADAQPLSRSRIYDILRSL